MNITQHAYTKATLWAKAGKAGCVLPDSAALMRATSHVRLGPDRSHAVPLASHDQGAEATSGRGPPDPSPNAGGYSEVSPPPPPKQPHAGGGAWRGLRTRGGATKTERVNVVSVALARNGGGSVARQV